jgi:hypothetical protein
VACSVVAGPEDSHYSADQDAEVTDATTSATSHIVQSNRRYLDVEICNDSEKCRGREEWRTREAEEEPLFPIVDNIADAVRPVVEEAARIAERSLDARLAVHSNTVERAADRRFRGIEDRLDALVSSQALSSRQSHASPGVGRGPLGKGHRAVEVAPVGGGGGNMATDGDWVGGITSSESGADDLLPMPRRRGALLALPKRK